MGKFLQDRILPKTKKAESRPPPMGGKTAILNEFIDKIECILVSKPLQGNFGRRLKRLKVDPPMGGKMLIFIDKIACILVGKR